VMHIGIICDDVFRTKIVINSVFIFTKVIFTAVILPNFCYPNKNIFLWIIFGKKKKNCWFFCRIMSAISSQRQVR
jgi:hypothetical protein